MFQKGRAWIEIHEQNLIDNISLFQSVLPDDCELMPAIKANAYGHGLILVAQILQKAGICNFCVASAAEGIELRKAGICGQILVLSYTHPQYFYELYKYDLTQTIIDLSYAQMLNNFGFPISAHVGIDTGMRRLGERSENIKNILNMWTFNNLKITGIFSHFCVSDGNSMQEREFTNMQVEKFKEIISILHQNGIFNFKAHIQSSYGVLNYPNLNFDYARLGIALYGVLSSAADTTLVSLPLKPVLSLKARIQTVKELYPGEAIGYGLTYTADKKQTIASVSIGYADGIPRCLSNKGSAIVNGHLTPMVGRICMDQLFLNVSDIPFVKAGDEAVFIGKSGDYEILASDIADSTNTIANEILSQLGPRLERIIV